MHRQTRAHTHTYTRARVRARPKDVKNERKPEKTAANVTVTNGKVHAKEAMLHALSLSFRFRSFSSSNPLKPQTKVLQPASFEFLVFFSGKKLWLWA